MDTTHLSFMQAAIDQARRGMEQGEGGPFGAVVVQNGLIVGRGNNRVLVDNDPTAHAEVMAIRDACARLQSFQLTDCVLYTSCEPCPMCLGAIYWARPRQVYYACNRHDAAAIGFDDSFIYEEVAMPLEARKIPIHPLLREEALSVFVAWEAKQNKTPY